MAHAGYIGAMTTTYDFAEVLDRLDDIVEEFGPETKQPACINRTDDGVPVCIVGALLDDLGIDINGYNGESVWSLGYFGTLKYAFDQETLNFLATIQGLADGEGDDSDVQVANGVSWGEALDETKKRWELA